MTSAHADEGLSTITTGGPQVRIAPDVYARWTRYMGRMQADMARPAGRVTLQDAMRDALDRAEASLAFDARPLPSGDVSDFSEED